MVQASMNPAAVGMSARMSVDTYLADLRAELLGINLAHTNTWVHPGCSSAVGCFGTPMDQALRAYMPGAGPCSFLHM